MSRRVNTRTTHAWVTPTLTQSVLDLFCRAEARSLSAPTGPLRGVLTDVLAIMTTVFTILAEITSILPDISPILAEILAIRPPMLSVFPQVTAISPQALSVLPHILPILLELCGTSPGALILLQLLPTLP